MIDLALPPDDLDDDIRCQVPKHSGLNVGIPDFFSKFLKKRTENQEVFHYVIAKAGSEEETFVLRNVARNDFEPSVSVW